MICCRTSRRTAYSGIVNTAAYVLARIRQIPLTRCAPCHRRVFAPRRVLEGVAAPGILLSSGGRQKLPAPPRPRRFAGERDDIGDFSSSMIQSVPHSSGLELDFTFNQTSLFLSMMRVLRNCWSCIFIRIRRTTWSCFTRMYGNRMHTSVHKGRDTERLLSRQVILSAHHWS